MTSKANARGVEKHTLSYSGGGKVSVPVRDIVQSRKVHLQVQAVRELAAAQAGKPRK